MSLASYQLLHPAVTLKIGLKWSSVKPILNVEKLLIKVLIKFLASLDAVRRGAYNESEVMMTRKNQLKYKSG